MDDNNRMFTITLDEDTLVTLLFGAAQCSCALDRQSLPDVPMWHLHCCDINGPLHQVLEQVDLQDFEDQVNKNYLSELKLKAKDFFNSHKKEME